MKCTVASLDVAKVQDDVAELKWLYSADSESTRSLSILISAQPLATTITDVFQDHHRVAAKVFRSHTNRSRSGTTILRTHQRASWKHRNLPQPWFALSESSLDPTMSNCCVWCMPYCITTALNRSYISSYPRYGVFLVVEISPRKHASQRPPER